MNSPLGFRILFFSNVYCLAGWWWCMTGQISNKKTMTQKKKIQKFTYLGCQWRFRREWKLSHHAHHVLTSAKTRKWHFSPDWDVKSNWQVMVVTKQAITIFLYYFVGVIFSISHQVQLKVKKIFMDATEVIHCETKETFF